MKRKILVIICLTIVSLQVKAQFIQEINPFNNILFFGSYIFSPQIIAKNKVKKIIIKSVSGKKDTTIFIISEFNKIGFPINSKYKDDLYKKNEYFTYDQSNRLIMHNISSETDFDYKINEICFVYDSKNRLIKQIDSDFSYFKKIKRKDTDYNSYSSTISEINYIDSNNSVVVDLIKLGFSKDSDIENKTLLKCFNGTLDSLLHPSIVYNFNFDKNIIEVKHLYYFTDCFIKDIDGCHSNQPWSERLYFENDKKEKLTKREEINCKNRVITYNYIYNVNGLLNKVTLDNNFDVDLFYYEFY